MSRLKIDTSKSLFKPLEVEIDGKVHRVKRLTRDVIQRIEALDAEVGEGNLSSAYKRLEILLGKSKMIDKLDIHQINEITKFIVQGAITPEKEEKNGSGPGDEKLPS